MRLASALAPLLAVGLLGCERGGERSGPGAAEGAPLAAAPRGGAIEPLPGGAVRVSGNNFHIDVAPSSGCTAAAGADCRLLADLAALGDFKVNKDYPFRFIPDGASKPLVSGEAAFTVTDLHTGRLSVPLEPAATRPARVSGTFKLSICNGDLCQVEDAALAVALP